MVLNAATHGVADAKRSHGRGVTVCAEATPTGMIVTIKRINVGAEIFSDNDKDLSRMGSS